MKTDTRKCSYCPKTFTTIEALLDHKCTRQPQPTPTPWRVGDAGHTVFGPKIDPYPYDSIAPTVIASNLKGSNAAFIVRAVNAHEELLDIVRYFASPTKEKTIDTNHHWYLVAKQAIAKADGK